ncbi:hypothetical protein SGPA1_20775 [Streptomyces misionensis JCM 4497]
MHSGRGPPRPRRSAPHRGRRQRPAGDDGRRVGRRPRVRSGPHRRRGRLGRRPRRHREPARPRPAGAGRGARDLTVPRGTARVLGRMTDGHGPGGMARIRPDRLTGTVGTPGGYVRVA